MSLTNETKRNEVICGYNTVVRSNKTSHLIGPKCAPRVNKLRGMVIMLEMRVPDRTTASHTCVKLRKNTQRGKEESHSLPRQMYAQSHF